MNRRQIWILIAGMLVIGLALGYVGGALLGSRAPGEVRNAKLGVGDVAPDFRLPDHTGGYVRLSDYRGEYNVVLAFYPLAWTPV